MKDDIWRRIVVHAARYPSPHNSQPIKLRLESELEATVYYDLDLGLPAENYGIPFGHVCAGVFLECLSIAAEAEGYIVKEKLYNEDMDFSSTDRLHRIAMVTLEKRTVDLTAAKQRLAALMKRQTSRRPYDSHLVDESIVDGAKTIAEQAGQRFSVTDDPTLVGSIIHVNQATLFDDLQNEAVYKEIMHWLRFSKGEAAKKRDGLSADTMIMPGAILHFAMRNRWLWQAPGIGMLVRWVYLRTMRGVRQLGWLEGRFNEPSDYLESGRCFMKIWIHFTEHDVYLHPFGTVITNPRSHKEFVKRAKITEDEKSMAWMLFRFGYSKEPPRAWHRDPETMIVEGEKK